MTQVSRKKNAAIARLPLGIIALCVAIIAILWGALLFDIDRSEQTALRQAGNDARNLSMAFREDIYRTVSAIDQVMLTVIAENAGTDHPYRIPDWVNNSPLLAGISVQVSMADADGVAVSSNLGNIAGRVDISDRPHFRYHLDPAAPQPFISVPVVGRNSGKWSIQITRRLTRADGSFAGIMVVSVDPFYFSQFFEGADLGEKGSVDLIGGDGIVRARRSRASQEIGQNVGETALFKSMQASQAGTKVVQSHLDGVTRIFGYAAVPRYPLFVVVGLAVNDVLAPAERQRTSYLAVGTFLTLVVAGLGWFLAAETRRRRQREVAEITNETVRRQKSLLDTALNNMRHGLLMFDQNRRAVVVNQSYRDIYGLSPEMAKEGCTIGDLLAQRAATGSFSGSIERYVERLFVSDRVIDEVLNLPDGRSIRVVNRFMDGGGWVSTHEDITELKQREESVRVLFENNPVPMFVIDCEDLTFLAVNQTAVRHYGFSREQFLAMLKTDLHPPEDRSAYIADFRCFRESGQTEFDSAKVRRHRTSDGTDILVHVFGRRLAYHGRPALLCSVMDVTERVQAERERDRNRELLDRIVDNITMTIQVKDARTLKYVLVNKAAERLWGLPREQLIGKAPHEIFDKDTADRIVEQDRQLLKQKSNLHVPEHKIATPHNGARIVISNRVPIRGHDGEIQYLIGAVEDVTERRAVEDQLRQAQKMEAVGNLTGGVAHDFNNLLTVILGNLELLQDEVAGNRNAEEKIQMIMEAAERGADLTGHMLAFSRRRPLSAKEVDVNALVATAMRLLSRTLGQNIAVVVEAMAAPAIAMVDPAQLETALVNIGINARDAMPNGGTLTVRTRAIELDADYAALHADVTPGHYVSIEVADTGTGMPAELLEHIFEPFFTTKAVGRGTGLGLSMVYGFVRQSGGHIQAYSEVGHGTVFKLFLPLAKSQQPQAKLRAIPAPAASPVRNEVILAVEDNPQIRATVLLQLRDLGYRVVEAENADAAMRILDSGERIDLLFTDVIMPGSMNGKQLAVRARASRADLKVVFTSGFPGTRDGGGAQLDTDDILLSKPYHRRDLARIIAETLGAPVCG